MRWTDHAVSACHRTVDAWRASWGGADRGRALAPIDARLAARVVEEPPLVVLWPEALDVAWTHVASSPSERGGLLVGEPLLASGGDATPAVVSVRAAVVGGAATSTATSLRMDTGVWEVARAALRPSEVIVGWFHSHPDLGAFFSGTDRRTQSGFFRHPFSLGWVIDPVRGEQAWFVGPDSLPLPGRSLLMPDRID